MNRRSRGFTAIELMVTVAILGVLAGIAAPAMGDFIDRQRLVGQTLAIADLAQTARSEAVKRRTTMDSGGGVDLVPEVVMSINAVTDWSIGLAHGDGTAACNSAVTCVLDKGTVREATYFLSKANASNCPACSVATTAVNPVVFDYRGLVRGGGGEVSITLTSPKSKQLRVRISTLGRISLCSPGGTVTGYPACP